MIRVASAAFELDWIESWHEYASKIYSWIHEAEADLLVFPEYGAMELATLAGADVAGDLEASLTAVSQRMERATEIFLVAAKRHGCHVLMPSGPVFDREASGGSLRPVNRARLIGPKGVIGEADKQVMTRFEREVWDVVPGAKLHTFDILGARIGVLICYDAEFPQLGRALIEQDVDILLVPSCTDALAGYWRVRVGAMARALEGQCVVIQSPTVGAYPWSPAVDMNVGAAAIYGPPDLGFPPTGVLAEGGLNTPGWTRADIDLAAIAKVRSEGQTLQRTHWPEATERAKLL